MLVLWLKNSGACPFAQRVPRNMPAQGQLGDRVMLSRPITACSFQVLLLLQKSCSFSAATGVLRARVDDCCHDYPGVLLANLYPINKYTTFVFFDTARAKTSEFAVLAPLGHER